MSKEPRRGVTFAMLDKEKGWPELPPATEEEYPLPAWYRAVQNIALDELGIEDIAKACRQRIHFEHVVPLALRLLQADPLAGEMYDGELLVSLKSVPPDYWSKNQNERQALKSVTESALREESVTPGVREDAQELLRTVS